MLNLIFWMLVRKRLVILGMVIEERIRLMVESMVRKRYMGLCSRFFIRMMRIMVRLFRVVKVYIKYRGKVS